MVLQLRHLLGIKPEQTVIFERFSDSAGGYITLDTNNPQVFKTLMRAAKAKLKLRLKATVTPLPEQQQEQSAPVPVEEDKTPQKTMEPVIVRTPPSTNTRDSTAFDGRSVGSGIFQFKEARATQQPLIDTSEAPLPRPFTANNHKILYGSDKEMRSGLAFRTKEPAAPAMVESQGHAWSVYCNNCDHAVTDEHFHCSICDSGDYDLCPDCVARGHLCPGEGHWLIKRFVKDGQVINSTTERISPRKIKKEEPEIKKEIPGAFTDDSKTLADVPRFASRTCNSCVIVLPDREFVTCTSCEDFDLCIRCHSANKHGHHPAHGFKPATEETVLSLTAETMLAPGRNVRHNAICDGCDKKIYGIRHKCLDCPDWDYCNDCINTSRRSHPRHRFTAIYSPVGDACPVFARHTGIYCDGPLCSKRGEQDFITGVRYKCAVCHDTDFCASCEALPANTHNRTHPLIKFKTPVKGVSISTENQSPDGSMRMMGDRRSAPIPIPAATKTASTETTPVKQANAATQVQTMAEIKPIDENKSAPAEKTVSATLLNARFVKDSVSDGTVFAPGTRFTQVFTMRNEGPYPWPAGCSVRHVGGDNMLNVDNSRPASVSDIRDATESNVIGRDVAVGEEIAFKITLKAPMREGKHISYWRMKSADGTPFGHRLWVDIEVKTPTQQSPAVPAVQPVVGSAAAPHPQQHSNQMHQMRLQQQRMLQAMQQQQMMQQRAMGNPQALQQGSSLPPPPAYDTLPNGANIADRIAAMREQQSKIRAQLMSQYGANRGQPQAQGINRGDMPSWNQHMAATASDALAQPTEEDKARKDAARQRVEHIKAKIIRAREEKAKAAEAKKKSSVEETEKVKKILEEVVKDNEAEKEAEAKKLESLEAQGSQMVFPKLDKESPASSTYQSVASTAGSSKGKAAYVENEEGEVERSATPTEVAAAPALIVESPKVEKEDSLADEDEDFEEIEVLSATGEESEEEDDGFLTDEEYDILDASDHETVASP